MITARMKYCNRNARRVLKSVIPNMTIKTVKSTTRAENAGNRIAAAAHSHPARKPNMYMTTARAWEK